MVKDNVIVDVFCAFCGKSFKINSTRLKFGRGKYCSSDCQYKGMRVVSEERVCPVCKGSFVVKVSSKRRFCSSLCRYKAVSLGLIKRKSCSRKNPKKKTPKRFQKDCLICGKTFKTDKKTQKYCGRGCFLVAHSRRMSGKGNYFYVNGNTKNKSSYRGEGWNIIRKKVYARDLWLCQICGKHCGAKVIQCHHIVPYKDGGTNDMSNLVTLCNICHAKVEKDVTKYNVLYFSDNSFLAPLSGVFKKDESYQTTLDDLLGN